MAGSKVYGRSHVIARLQSMRDRVGKKPDPRVLVGYLAVYAIYVHEDLTMNHPRGGEAKYLEKPLRLHRRTMANMIAADIQRNKWMRTALKNAGNFLLAESRKLVPVDTGWLKQSGYVIVE